MNTIIQPKHKPRLRRSPPKAGLSFQGTVRIYQDSPESITLQIRLGGTYVSVPLTFDEAQAVRNALTSSLPCQWSEQPVKILWPPDHKKPE